MSDTIRRVHIGRRGATLWTHEMMYPQLVRKLGGDINAAVTRLNARIQRDLPAGRRNAAADFRRRLNRTYRSKVNHALRAAVAQDRDMDALALPVQKPSANWEWF